MGWNSTWTLPQRLASQLNNMPWSKCVVVMIIQSPSPFGLSFAQRPYRVPSAEIRTAAWSLMAWHGGSSGPQSQPPAACFLTPVYGPTGRQIYAYLVITSECNYGLKTHRGQGGKCQKRSQISKLRCQEMKIRMISVVFKKWNNDNKCTNVCLCVWFGLLAFSIYTARRSLRATISCLSLVRVIIKAWFSAAAASKSSFGPSPIDIPKHNAPILTLL